MTTLPAFPVIPLRGLALFPGAVTPLMVGGEAMDAVEGALLSGAPLAFVAQIDANLDRLVPGDLFEIGCMGRALRSVRFPDGSARVLVEGLARVRITDLALTPTGSFVAHPLPLQETIEGDPTAVDALAVLLREHLETLLSEDMDLPAELSRAVPEGPAGRLADYAVGVLKPPFAVQQALLHETDVGERLAAVFEESARAVARLALNNAVHEKVQKAMDEGQREYYLKEQLKVIRAELGEADGLDDVDRMRQRLEEAELPATAMAEADRELARMRRMHSDGAEYNVARTWLDWLADLPWAIATDDSFDLRAAAGVLDEDHYGLQTVKERILEYIAVRKLKPDARGMILCFVGPPGVGKTSLGASIARSLGRAFQRVSLGGVHDEAEIRGHRRTYIGAMPGRILQAMKRAGTNNPVILLDEIDKLGQDFRGDPGSALLEVLDPEQNSSFTDHYLAVPFDLSQVLFVATANVASAIPAALFDRLETIDLSGYIEEEKLQIARRHLLPRSLEAHGLTDQVSLTREALEILVRRYTREAGVRELERTLARLHRKAARKVVEGRKRGMRITPERLVDWLGPPPYHVEIAEQMDHPGVAVGLAWTSVGGVILFVEAARFSGGKGLLKLTGSMGDVMKESVEAAFSLLRGVPRLASRFSPGDFSDYDYHLHMPAGAIPKDGPSAGLAMFTALASLMSGRPARSEVAMTGEITLRGKVLPVGGIKEKILAARRAGVKHVVLPRDNQHDLEDVAQELVRDLTFHFVSEVAEVLPLTLSDDEAPRP